MKFEQILLKLKLDGFPLFAVLIDPDKFNPDLIVKCLHCNVDCFLVGGSKIKTGNISETVKKIKSLSKIPVILFPGDETHITSFADGIFLPSLLSGNNPDYLIGKQILMAPLIKKMKLPFASMAYLLIDGGKKSSTQAVTKTFPLKISEEEKIVNICLAAEQLGFKLIYLEAGSGANSSVPGSLIKKVKREIKIPLIVGGGINSAKKINALKNTGANMIVVGNALEKKLTLVNELSDCFNL